MAGTAATAPVAGILGVGAAALATSALVVALTTNVMGNMKQQAISQVEAAIESNAAAQAVAATVGNDVGQVPVSADGTQSDVTTETGLSAVSAPDVSMSDGAPIEREDGADAPAAEGSADLGTTDVDAATGTDTGATETSSDAVVSVARSEHSGEVYNVKWGDTLSSISAEFGRSVDAIANANDIRDVNLIYADSALIIPD